MERRAQETETTRRPGSEYAERPAGAPAAEPRGGDAPLRGESIDERARVILGALKRDGRMGEPALAREAGVEITQINDLLVHLQQAGRVTRTSDGSWELTPAADATTEPRPSPSEPRQADDRA